MRLSFQYNYLTEVIGIDCRSARSTVAINLSAASARSCVKLKFVLVKLIIRDSTCKKIKNFANGKIRSYYDLELGSRHWSRKGSSYDFHLCGKRLETISARLLKGNSLVSGSEVEARRKDTSSSSRCLAFIPEIDSRDRTRKRSTRKDAVRLPLVIALVRLIASPRGLYNFPPVISFTSNYSEDITSLEEKCYVTS